MAAATCEDLALETLTSALLLEAVEACSGSVDELVALYEFLSVCEPADVGNPF